MTGVRVVMLGVAGLGTAQGALADFFRTVAAHLPAPPSFVDAPLAWGDEGHVRELFEGTGVYLEVLYETWDIGHHSAAVAVDCYTAAFGPVVEVRQIAEGNGPWTMLHDDMTALFKRLNTSGDSKVVFPAEYVVATGTRVRRPRVPG